MSLLFFCFIGCPLCLQRFLKNQDAKYGAIWLVFSTIYLVLYKRGLQAEPSIPCLITFLLSLMIPQWFFVSEIWLHYVKSFSLSIRFTFYFFCAVFVEFISCLGCLSMFSFVLGFWKEDHWLSTSWVTTRTIVILVNTLYLLSMCCFNDHMFLDLYSEHNFLALHFPDVLSEVFLPFLGERELFPFSVATPTWGLNCFLWLLSEWFEFARSQDQRWRLQFYSQEGVNNLDCWATTFIT